VAIVPPRSVRGRGHPTSALLVIEISDSSLRKDRTVKMRVYARAGLPEYWIVNALEGCVEIYRDPDAEAGSYRTTLRVEPGDEAVSASVPGVAVKVANLFD
jgi:Uma2 family endonuclease